MGGNNFGMSEWKQLGCPSDQHKRVTGVQCYCSRIWEVTKVDVLSLHLKQVRRWGAQGKFLGSIYLELGGY